MRPNFWRLGSSYLKYARNTESNYPPTLFRVSYTHTPRQAPVVDVQHKRTASPAHANLHVGPDLRSRIVSCLYFSGEQAPACTR